MYKIACSAYNDSQFFGGEKEMPDESSARAMAAAILDVLKKSHMTRENEILVMRELLLMRGAEAPSGLPIITMPMGDKFVKKGVLGRYRAGGRIAGYQLASPVVAEALELIKSHPQGKYFVLKD
jgi:hypothetical protein